MVAEEYLSLQQIMAEDASTGRDTLFVNYNYDINDNHSINARGMVTKVNGFGRFAPVADSLTLIVLNGLDVLISS